MAIVEEVDIVVRYKSSSHRSSKRWICLIIIIIIITPPLKVVALHGHW